MIKVRIDELFHKNSFGIWVMHVDAAGETSVAKPVPFQFGDKKLGAFMLPEPTFELRPEYAEQFYVAMANELRRKGFTSSDERVTGLYEAQSKHLEDMRKLVFK